MANNEKKEQESKKKDVSSAQTWLVVWFLILGIGIAGFLLKMYLAGVITIGVFVLLFPLIVYFGFAPLNVFWTLVEEGTAKIVVKGEGFSKALIQWEERTLSLITGDVKEIGPNEGGTVYYDEPEHPLGGLRWYGFWPFKTIKKYRLRWTTARENGELVPHDEILDSVSLKDFIYGMELKKAESLDKIPLDIIALIRLRVINPRKALFNVQDWLEAVINATKSLVREYIATYGYEDLLAKKESIGEDIKTKLKEKGWFDTFQHQYGVEIVEKTKMPDGKEIEVEAIKVRDITPPDEHQRAATKEKLAEWERKRIVGETMGSLAEMLSLGKGATPEQIEEKIKNSPQAAQIAQDFIHRRMAIDGRSFVDIRVPGAGDLEKALIRIMGALKQLPSGGGKGGEKESSESDPEKEEGDRRERERIKQEREAEKKARKSD